MTKKLVLWILLFAVCLSLFACKKGEKDISTGPTTHCFYSLHHFTRTAREAKQFQREGIQLSSAQERILRYIEDVVPYPSAIQEGYTLYEIRLSSSLSYVFYFGDQLKMQKERYIVFCAPLFDYETEEQLESKTKSIIEGGGEQHPEDGVIYDASNNKMYFRYNNNWAFVTVSDDLNTYNQLLALCQYEIVSIYDANTPVQTTGTQATSAKATATN